MTNDAKPDDAYVAEFSAGPHDECPFCADTLDRSVSEFDQVLIQNEDLNLIPALGMLVPGYFLVTARRHVLSLANTRRRSLIRADSWSRTITRKFQPVFGNYLRFEHGGVGAGSSGICVLHAHVHLIPVADLIGESIRSALPWIRLNNYGDLAKYAGRNYAYLGLQEESFVCPEPGLPSQWIRRFVGAALETDAWDWAVDPGMENLQTTLKGVQDLGFKTSANPHRLAASLSDMPM